MSNPQQGDAVALNLQDVQAVGLDILLKFDEYCKRHGLRFYLCGGTLLGAVRHGGFIPWDDDIDVFMARPDFDRLIELDRTEPFGGDCELACVLNGKLPRAFAKLYFTRTHVDRPYLKPIGGPHLWIDILPVDGLPDDPGVYRRLLRLRSFLEMQNLASMWKVGKGHRKKMILQYAARYPLAVLVGKWRWARWMDRLGRRLPYETSPTVGTLVSGRYGPGEAMPKARYEIPAKIDFAGHSFETMSCYREYLSGIYGDYMTPPPENCRGAHIVGVTMSRGDFDALCREHPELREGHPELRG